MVTSEYDEVHFFFFWLIDISVLSFQGHNAAVKHISVNQDQIITENWDDVINATGFNTCFFISIHSVR